MWMKGWVAGWIRAYGPEARNGLLGRKARRRAIGGLAGEHVFAAGAEPSPVQAGGSVAGYQEKVKVMLRFTGKPPEFTVPEIVPTLPLNEQL